MQRYVRIAASNILGKLYSTSKLYCCQKKSRKLSSLLPQPLSSSETGSRSPSSAASSSSSSFMEARKRKEKAAAQHSLSPLPFFSFSPLPFSSFFYVWESNKTASAVFFWVLAHWGVKIKGRRRTHTTERSHTATGWDLLYSFEYFFPPLMCGKRGVLIRKKKTQHLLQLLVSPKSGGNTVKTFLSLFRDLVIHVGQHHITSHTKK